MIQPLQIKRRQLPGWADSEAVKLTRQGNRPAWLCSNAMISQWHKGINSATSAGENNSQPFHPQAWYLHSRYTPSGMVYLKMYHCIPVTTFLMTWVICTIIQESSSLLPGGKALMHALSFSSRSVGSWTTTRQNDYVPLLVTYQSFSHWLGINFSIHCLTIL